MGATYFGWRISQRIVKETLNYLGLPDRRAAQRAAGHRRKGYDADALVQSIGQAGDQRVIPLRSKQCCPRTVDRHRYRARHLMIENLFARLKH
jgi:hypothetical protein